MGTDKPAVLGSVAIEQLREVVHKVLNEQPPNIVNHPSEHRPQPNRVIRVKLDAALSSGASATASLYEYASDAWSDTDINVTVNEVLGSCGDIASGTFCLATRVVGIGWSVIAAQCSCNEIQRIIITGMPTGGTYTLTFDGQTTGNIDYDAAAGNVQNALEALSNIGAGNVVCFGGPHPGSYIDVEFVGDLADTDVAEMTSTDSLTGGSLPATVITTLNDGG